jgi:hypothetical protein
MAKWRTNGEELPFLNDPHLLRANLRANPPKVVELCGCEWDDED